jgi:hypothetical protein
MTDNQKGLATVMTNTSDSPAVGNGDDTDEAPDPFDLDNLRFTQDFTETAGVKKQLTTVLVRKPRKHEFIRVHPNEEYRNDFPIIELQDEDRREEYLIVRDLVPELAGEFVCKTLFTAINRQGVVFLWPVRFPPPGDKPVEWWRSAREGAEMAMRQWLRIKADIPLGAYEMYVALSNLSEPVWPKATFKELISIAFRDRLIDRIDHPVIKRLRGLM